MPAHVTGTAATVLADPEVVEAVWEMNVLELRRLGAHCGQLRVLHGLDLYMGAGEVVSVLGANGGGKSTLPKCIAGMMASHSTGMSLDGKPIDGL